MSVSAVGHLRKNILGRSKTSRRRRRSSSSSPCLTFSPFPHGFLRISLLASPSRCFSPCPPHRPTRKSSQLLVARDALEHRSQRAPSDNNVPRGSFHFPR